MPSFLRTVPLDQLNLNGARVLSAAAVPASSHLVFATDASQLICPPDTSVPIPSFSRGIACARYASFDAHSLPEQRAVALTLLETHGLCLFSIPDLQPLHPDLVDHLQQLSKTAHIFSVDSLGSDVVSESFRVAFACDDTVSLLDVNPSREKVTLLGQHKLDDRLVAVAFSEMTIVASTPRLHYMLRISRGGGLAVAATVERFVTRRRPRDGSTAVMSFFGGLFTRRDLSNPVAPALALALPDNQWLLVVDDELVAYSSFGAKLDDMEYVFKSKVGMEALDMGSIGKGSSIDGKAKSKPPTVLVKSGSMSSLGSAATGISRMTLMDQSTASRSEKPPTVTLFSSPFVLSVTENNKITAFAANGALPGIIDELQLLDSDELIAQGAMPKLIASRYSRVLATAYWPNGQGVRVELVDNVTTLSETMEADGQLRHALALVGAEESERIVELRRQLAWDARRQDWHDGAIQHFQVVVNLSMRTEDVNEVDLIGEAVELRGEVGSSWHADEMTATLWADFLFKLRRRVMRASQWDFDVLETLVRADESSARVKALFSVKHDVEVGAGEELISSSESILREEERVEALVGLYTSRGEHGKALVLLESLKMSNAVDGVIGYLSGSMTAWDDEKTFFEHLKWVAERVAEEKKGWDKFEGLVWTIVGGGEGMEEVMGRLMEVLVEWAEDLGVRVIDEGTKEDKLESTQHGEVLCHALLRGMAQAKSCGNSGMFERLRRLLNERLVETDYGVLAALQDEKFVGLGLHEERALLLGRQGRHEAAADELAAEVGLGADEALGRLKGMMPGRDWMGVGEALVGAYVRVSRQGRAMRIEDAAEVVRWGGGQLEVERAIGEKEDGEELTLEQMWPLMREGLLGANGRVRVAEMVRAMRRSEVGRLREEVVQRRRRFVVVGEDRACSLCTRRLGDSAFVAYGDGSVAHLTCHQSRDLSS